MASAPRESVCIGKSPPISGQERSEGAGEQLGSLQTWVGTSPGARVSPVFFAVVNGMAQDGLERRIAFGRGAGSVRRKLPPYISNQQKTRQNVSRPRIYFSLVDCGAKGTSCGLTLGFASGRRLRRFAKFSE